MAIDQENREWQESANGEIKEMLKPEEMIKRFREFGYEEYAEAYEKVLEISQAIKEAGGEALLVGGSVRDMFFNKIPKDFDLEVYKLEAPEIAKIIEKFGKVSEVGKAFGIIKVFLPNGIDIDVSLPRTDSKAGEGHKGFDVKTDPNMSIKDAASRRDFTMNSMASNPLTGELHDPFKGLQDIENRILRVTDFEKFQDDPVRAERAPQFVGRFGLEIEKRSLELMKTMVPELKEEPKSRIIEEWKKLLIKSDKPSLGLIAAKSIGIFKELHPEFDDLTKVPQEKEWHPEGDVWMHTLMSVDEATKLCREYDLEEETTLIIMLSSLCHDLGKKSTTETIEKDGEMRITSHGHEQAGEEPTKKFLSDIGVDGLTRGKVVNLVTNHLVPSMWFIDSTIRNQEVSKGAFNRLAKKIHPATMRELALTGAADHRGRGPFSNPENPEQLMMPENFPAGKWFVDKAREYGVEKSKPADLIGGKDLFAFGFKNSGPAWGEIIGLANDLRDDKDFTKDMIFQSLIDNEKANIIDEKTALDKLKSLLGKE
ncbi:MAG: HD domain-containing protein [Patescibacteria group bacterium]|nr:HD domain-containing protein [Patescibacteria group bacterium]